MWDEECAGRQRVYGWAPGVGGERHVCWAPGLEGRVPPVEVLEGSAAAWLGSPATFRNFLAFFKRLRVMPDRAECFSFPSPFRSEIANSLSLRTIGRRRGKSRHRCRPPLPEPPRSLRRRGDTTADRQNFGKMLLVFGCIGTDFCKKIRVFQHFSKSTRLSS